MELNREQIIKNLECAIEWGCGMYREVEVSDITKALALIRELTEANKRLTSLCTSKDIIVSDLNAENTRLRKEVEYWEAEVKEARADIDQSTAEARADTVREMRSRLYKEFLKVAHIQLANEPNMRSQEVFAILDQIAKEMLEGNERYLEKSAPTTAEFRSSPSN